MVQLSEGHQRAQEKMYAGAVLHANPAHQILFVDSDNGNNGNNGLSPRQPLLTLTQALTLAQAGDTIQLAPGGSETVTASLAVSLADLNIVCPVLNSNQGFSIIGAGSLDLMTVSASDVRIEGLRFARTASAGGTTASILTTADADRLLVKNCMFDAILTSSAWTNFGVEIVGALDNIHIIGCEFRDLHRGVEWTLPSGGQKAALIKDCVFWVGQATAYGIHADVVGTVTGLRVEDCTFFELDGDGSAATDAWDGTTPTNGASGPIKFGGTTDQYIVQGCRCSGAVDFENRLTIDAGAAGTLVANVSGGSSAADVLSAIGDANTSLAVISTAVQALSTAVQTLSTVCQATNDEMSTANGHLTVISTAVQTLSTVCQATNDEMSTANGHLTVISTAVQALSTAVQTLSTVCQATNDEMSTANGHLTVISTAVQALSTAVQTLSTVCQATNDELSTAQGDLTLLRTGSKFWISKALDSSAIIVSTLDLTGVSSGSDLFINNVIYQTDGTGLATATNFQLTINNARGLLVFFSESIANLGANKSVDMETASVVNQRVVLETGKKILFNATAAPSDGAGAVTVYVEFERMGPTGTIAAA